MATQAGSSENGARASLAAARLANPEVVKKLFDDIAHGMADRPGGYTRI